MLDDDKYRVEVGFGCVYLKAEGEDILLGINPRDAWKVATDIEISAAQAPWDGAVISTFKTLSGRDVSAVFFSKARALQIAEELRLAAEIAKHLVPPILPHVPMPEPEKPEPEKPEPEKPARTQRPWWRRGLNLWG